MSPIIGWALFFVVLFGLFGLMNTLSPQSASEPSSAYENYDDRRHDPEPCITCELEDRIADLERKTQ